MKKRMLSICLIFALCLSLFPVSALADVVVVDPGGDGGDTTVEVNPGGGGDAVVIIPGGNDGNVVVVVTPDEEGPPAIGDTVVFAGHEWYIIGTETEGVTAPTGCYTLFAKNNDFGSTAFRAGTNEEDSTAYNYKDSDLKKKMEDIANGFSAEDRDNIVPRDELDEIKGEPVTNQLLWPIGSILDKKNTSIDGEAARIDASLRQFDAIYWGRTGQLNKPSATNVFDPATGKPIEENVHNRHSVIAYKTDGSERWETDSGVLGGQRASTVTNEFAVRPALYVKTEAFTPDDGKDTAPLTGSKVFYGDRYWYIVGMGDIGPVTGPANTVTLFSSASITDSNGNPLQAKTNTNYSEGPLCQTMKNLGNTLGLSEKEQSLISKRYLTQGDEISGDSTLTSFWPLSKSEFEAIQAENQSLLKETDDAYHGYNYWLRTPSDTDEIKDGDKDVYSAKADGTLQSHEAGENGWSDLVRPAFYLDLSNLFFAAGFQSMTGTYSDHPNKLEPPTSNTNEWTFVLYDKDLALDLYFSSAEQRLQRGKSLTFQYSGTPGEECYLSYVLEKADAPGVPVYYGSAGRLDSSGSGTVTVPLLGSGTPLEDGDYILRLYTEDQSGEGIYFASDTVDMTIHVDLGMQKASIKDQGDVQNTSRVEQVAFGGQYWYVVGDGTGTRPVIARDCFMLFAQDPIGTATADGAQQTIDSWAKSFDDRLNTLVKPKEMDNGEKENFWSLSQSEAQQIGNPDILKSSVDQADAYWLSTSAGSETNNAVSATDGSLIQRNSTESLGVRPAFYLTSSVIYEETKDVKKSTVGDAPYPLTSDDVSVYKFTCEMKDLNLDMTATPFQQNQTGSSLTFGYKNTTTGQGRYLACAFTSGWRIHYYTKLVDLSNSSSASGTVTLSMDGVADGDYTLKFYVEEPNEMSVDYASLPLLVKISVKDGVATVTGFVQSSDKIVEKIEAPAITDIVIEPSVSSVDPGATQLFSATVSGEADGYDPSVSWSVTGNQSVGTTISETGLLSVAADETAESLTVTATSKQDSTKSATATVMITAHSHSGTLVSGTPATCTTEGVKDYYQCSICKAVFEDADCTKPITDLDSWKVIPESGHSWSADYLAANADAEKHYHVCTVCAEKDAGEAHSYDNDQDSICNVCGYKREITPPEETTYKVTLNANDGTINSGDIKEYTHGTVTTLPTDVTREGYTFAGWYDNKELTGNPMKEIPADATGDKVYWAKWTTSAYSITVQNDGNGEASADKTTAAEGETVTLSATPNSGYHFERWEVLSGDVTIDNNTFIMPAESVAIKAIFARNSAVTPPIDPPTVSEETINAIADAEPGETVTVDLSSGSTTLDKEVFETLAGKDVTLVVDLGDDVSWTVNGMDIPEDTDFTDLDLGVTMNSDGIPVDIINAITGEHGSVQVELAHNGAFGFTMTLTAPVGEENAGLWANLYHFKVNDGEAGREGPLGDDEEAGEMTFETAAQIGDDGSVSLAFSHASQYAIVIDDHNHGVVELPFTDVSDSDWFYEPVCYVYENGLMTGTSETTFEPNTSLSRAMLVAVLHRLEGSPAASGSDFTDVADGDWYAQAVNWAASVGVVNGFDDGTFQPNTAITREQLAAILRNYAEYKGLDTSTSGDLSTYTDAGIVSNWAKESVEWVVGSGLIGGYEDSTLRPQGTTTRAEVAAVLQRYLAN